MKAPTLVTRNLNLTKVGRRARLLVPNKFFSKKEKKRLPGSRTRTWNCDPRRAEDLHEAGYPVSLRCVTITPIQALLTEHGQLNNINKLLGCRTLGDAQENQANWVGKSTSVPIFGFNKGEGDCGCLET